MNKKYLVTGAAGFIGSKLAERLIKKGDKVVSIDNLSTGNMDAVPNGVELIIGDCQDVDIIKKLRNYQFDAIFHLAGQSSGEVSFEDPVYDLQTNTQSTLLLLKYAESIKCNNFIYASTMSVYGDQEKLPVNETAVCNPKSFYAVGKLASEKYLKLYSELGINCTVLRLFNVYGPGQNLDNLKQGMLSIFLAMALRDGKVIVKGDKKRFRDFVYIETVIDAFLAAEKNNHSSFKIYNVCSGEKITVEKLLSTLNSYFNNSLSIDFINGTPGDQFGIFGDPKKIQKELSLDSSVKFELGLKSMLSWAKTL